MKDNFRFSVYMKNGQWIVTDTLEDVIFCTATSREFAIIICDCLNSQFE
jgi:hypothetical protein